MKDVDVLGDGWRGVLTEISSRLDLAQTAMTSGAFRQGRGVPDAATLLRLCLLYASGYSLRQVCAWGAASGEACLSNPALVRRLRQSVAWLSEIAGTLLGVPALGPAAGGRRVRLIDATCVRSPGARETSWRLHLGFDLTQGRLEHVALTDGRGAEKLERFAPMSGVLDIADAGYGRASPLRARLAAGGDVLLRISWRSMRLRHEDGHTPFDLLAALRGMAGDVAEWTVAVEDGKKGQAPVPLRLIAARKPEEARRAALKRWHRRAQKQGHQIEQGTIEAAGFVLLVTSLPADAASPSQLLALYRLRWQVELAIKRLKSLLGLGNLPAKSPELASCWLYGKLILALLIEQRMAAVRGLSPLEQSRHGKAITVDPLPLGLTADPRRPERMPAMAPFP